MIAMSVQDDWISVAKAAELAGCSQQFIRRDLLEHLPRDASGKPESDRTSGGRLEGWLVNGRAWLVSKASAAALRGSLTSRATGNRGPAKASTGRKKTAKRRKSR
jgi:hypothetical protein